jgi:hypothetical protein
MGRTDNSVLHGMFSHCMFISLLKRLADLGSIQLHHSLVQTLFPAYYFVADDDLACTRIAFGYVSVRVKPVLTSKKETVSKGNIWPTANIVFLSAFNSRSSFDTHIQVILSLVNMALCLCAFPSGFSLQSNIISHVTQT